MPRFQVFGADRRTGSDTSIVVDTASEETAAAAAGATLLVERVARLPAPVQNARPQDSRRKYRTLKGAAGTVSVLSTLLLFGSVITILASIGACSNTETRANGIMLLIAGISGMVQSALLQFCAAMGFAVRDVAVWVKEQRERSGEA